MAVVSGHSELQMTQLGWNATDVDCPSSAIDDDTASRVVDAAVDVVSDGTWRTFDTGQSNS